MDKNKLTTILKKADSLQKGKEVALAKEFIALDEKLESIQEKTDKLLQETDEKLSEVKEEIIKEMPVIDFPEYPTEMKVSNLPEVQKVEVTNLPENKAPIVNVKAPIVSVEAPIVNIDTEKIESELKTSNETLKGISEKLNEESDEIEKVTLVDEKGKPIKFPTQTIVGGGGGPDKYIKNVAGEVINPATEEKQTELNTNIVNLPSAFDDEALWLLRRMVKLMESNATVDILNRQKITIDAMTPGMGAAFGIGVSLVGNGPTASAPTLATLYPLPVWEGPVDQRWRVIEQAKINYNTGVRASLSFH